MKPLMLAKACGVVFSLAVAAYFIHGKVTRARTTAPPGAEVSPQFFSGSKSAGMIPAISETAPVEDPTGESEAWMTSAGFMLGSKSAPIIDAGDVQPTTEPASEPAAAPEPPQAPTRAAQQSAARSTAP